MVFGHGPYVWIGSESFRDNDTPFISLWQNIICNKLRNKVVPATVTQKCKCLCIPRDYPEKFSLPYWSSSLHQLPSVNMSRTSWQAGNNQWSWEKSYPFPRSWALEPHRDECSHPCSSASTLNTAPHKTFLKVTDNTAALFPETCNE